VCLLAQVIAPLLLFSVGVDSRICSVVLDEWALDGAYVCVTPAKSTSQCGTSTTEVFVNIIRYHDNGTTVVSSPRIHPGVVYHSLLLSCCQLVMSLCGCPPSSQISGAVVPVIRCGMDHVMHVMYGLCDTIVRSCDTIVRPCDTIVRSCDTIVRSCDTITRSCDTLVRSCDTCNRPVQKYHK